MMSTAPCWAFAVCHLVVPRGLGATIPSHVVSPNSDSVSALHKISLWVQENGCTISVSFWHEQILKPSGSHVFRAQ